MRRFFYCLPIICIFFLVSCASNSTVIRDISSDSQDSINLIEEEGVELQEEVSTEEVAQQIEKSQVKKLTLTFAGDIMAHTPNFKMKDYSLIYKDIEEIILNDDFTFANLETPVHMDRPYENYPTFNVQPPYVQAAIDAGFQVFSLANNHTNDQGLQGIDATLYYFKSKISDGVYSAGIKEVGQSTLSYQVIEKDDWRILFVAITEIMNTHRYLDRIDYISPNKARREVLCQELKTLRQENPCDIFVLSVHTCEDEYVHEITELRRNLYRSFIDSGVDIVWANHPHLAKEWEIFQKDSEEGTFPYAIAMYALGNTISGQRTNPQFSKPETNRDYTGDGYLIQVDFEKIMDPDDFSFKITDIRPYLITTYIDPDKNYVIKQLDDEFIQSLRDEGIEKWPDYLNSRKILMEKISGKVVIE